MNYFVLDPEVAGELGPRTEMDTTVHPPLIKKLHYVVDAWLGDDLVQSFPCYLVTDRLKSALQDLSATGVSFAAAEVTASDAFAELHPAQMLPSLSWLQVTGQAGADDFGLASDARLIVSERALSHMRRFHLSHCDVAAYPIDS